ncbi:MAG: ribosomal-processing cysteine protease Prp [Defluviitaleaceae bacterium]|nr:ribosomal-processing cysteine protease Prp [Defluviitaleaceae bacterium]
MINAEIIRGESGNVIGFTVKNHGESHVCAAVSMLTVNTVNSIENLTDDAIRYECNEKIGFLGFALCSPDSQSEGAKILLDAMVLGLKCTQDEHPDEILLIDPQIE